MVWSCAPRIARCVPRVWTRFIKKSSQELITVLFKTGPNFFSFNLWISTVKTELCPEHSLQTLVKMLQALGVFQTLGTLLQTLRTLFQTLGVPPPVIQLFTMIFICCLYYHVFKKVYITQVWCAARGRHTVVCERKASISARRRGCDPADPRPNQFCGTAGGAARRICSIKVNKKPVAKEPVY